MYTKNNKGFSLIEIIISTSILTIAVFGVYKLIGENTKIISSSNNFVNMNLLISSVEECIEFNNTNTVNKYINLNDCSLSDSNMGIIVDNINYEIFTENTGVKTWDITIIGDGVGEITSEYIQK